MWIFYGLALVIVAVACAVAALFVAGVIVALAAMAALVLAIVWLIERFGWTGSSTRQSGDSES